MSVRALIEDICHGDGLRSAWSILDNDRPALGFGEFGRNHAAGDVRRSARGRGHHDPDRPRRKGLSGSLRDARSEAQCDQRQSASVYLKT